MKLFLKILSGILVLIIVALVGLNFYFTDARLKAMILPKVKEAVGTEVQVQNMSLTFFKTFPRVGVELNEFVLPNPAGDTVATLGELLVGVELLPLLKDEISISELILNEPVINYHISENNTSNVDFLFDMMEEPEDTTQAESGYAITIPNFTIQSASVNYRDEAGQMYFSLDDLDANISLQFADLIESSVQADLGSLSVTMNNTRYIDNLALSLNQTSTIDLENEKLNLNEGVLSIRGLALNLTGAISSWSGESPVLDLKFSSNSENFGELLRLVPPEYDEYLAGLETRGALELEGSVSGSYSEDNLPDFNLLLAVEDGYLKNPDLPEAIENIQIQLTADNELITIQEFKATAAENSILASGAVNNPLEDNATFSLDFDADVNLATVSRFYPIDEFGLQKLDGLLAAKATANGTVTTPEEAEFSGNFSLTDGRLQYAGVPQQIENINAVIQARQDKITIKNIEFEAAKNQFSMSGTVTNPLDENSRNINLSADLDFDLATVKEFYPIDEDTLKMRGKLVAKVNLQGKPDPDQIEKLLKKSTINLQNGYIEHELVGKPLEDVTFVAEATGTRLTVRQARFKTGQNTLAMNGTVDNYLSENPHFNLNLDGEAVLNEVSAYYSLEPWVQQLAGFAEMDLKANGPAGNPKNIKLNGSLELDKVSAKGDSLPLPVSDLDGTFSITPAEMSLDNFSMKFGSSDIKLEGKMKNYLGLMEENPSQNSMPSITGSYQSDLLNMDEMIDWEAESSDEPVLIELPEITSSVTANIKKLIILGLEITNISGKGGTTPNEITLNQAKATLFGGTATGNMVWKVPKPNRTNITFNGALNNLKAEAFFRDTGFLGEKSAIHKYLTGAFSADIKYYTQLDEMLSPDISTTTANGSFGMTRARLSGHPIQKKVADFLKVNELSSLALDAWKANFTIKNEVLTFQDFNLTSENIGLELAGTMHLVNDRIDFDATVSLPSRFKKGIASVLPKGAADALQREDGTIAVPLQITGTSTNPKVGPNDDVIKGLLEDYLKDKGEDLLNKLFGD